MLLSNLNELSLGILTRTWVQGGDTNVMCLLWLKTLWHSEVMCPRKAIQPVIGAPEWEPWTEPVTFVVIPLSAFSLCTNMSSQ